MNRHLRKAVVVTAAITAGLLMTACQNDSASTGGSSTPSSASSSEAGSQSKSQSGASGTSAGNKSSGTVANNASSSKSGVSGTFENGTVSYLAPGKYIVAVPGRTQQAFFVAEDTVVHGAGTLCKGAVCTLDQLEAATKKGAVPADVTLKNGIATVITERPAAQEGSVFGKGVSGTWLGQVKYLAPGKYTVSGQKDTQQAFFVAEDTVVNGAGTICGTQGSAETRCTLDELEAAAKKGLTAKVELTDGIATTITEDH